MADRIGADFGGPAARAIAERNRARGRAGRMGAQVVGFIEGNLKSVADQMKNDPIGFATGFVGGTKLGVVKGGARSLKPLENLSKSGLASRLKKVRGELGKIAGVKIRSPHTNKAQKAIDKTLKAADEAKVARIRSLVNQIDDISTRIGPDLRFSGPPVKGPTGEPVPTDPVLRSLKGIDSKGFPVDVYRAIRTLQETSRVRSGARVTSNPGHKLALGSAEDIKFMNAALKQKYGRGILDFKFPDDSTFNPQNLLVDKASLEFRPSNIKARVVRILNSNIVPIK